MIAQYGFKSFINISTRTPCYSMHSSLDHIFFKALFFVLKQIEAGVIQTEITDHFSTIVAIPKGIYENINYPPNFNSINFCLVNDTLKEENWSPLYYNRTNVNECVDIFCGKIFNAIEKASILKKVNAINHKIKEWMTLGLLTSARRKNNLYKKVKKHQFNLILRRFYNTYRNNFNTIVRLAKINFYKKKFFKLQHDPKQTWNLVNEIIGSAR